MGLGARLASRGPIPVDGRCLYCGGRLRSLDGGRGGKFGTGQFCSLTCGFWFASLVAHRGERVTSPRRLAVASFTPVTEVEHGAS